MKTKTSLFLILNFLFMMATLSSIASVKISGIIKNANGLTDIRIHYEHDLFEFKSFETKLDKNGSFEFATDYVRGNVLMVSIQNIFFYCFVKPNKAIELEADLDNFANTLNFKNDLARENNFFAQELKLGVMDELNSYRNFTDANLYNTHIESIMKLDIELWQNYNKSDLDVDFINHISLSLKYKHVNGLWMYKIGYDNATNKFVNKEIPVDYFNFLDTLKFDSIIDAEHSDFTTALMRYLFEKFDKNSIVNLPIEYSDIQKSKYSFLSKYNYRKEFLKGDILEFELISMLRNTTKYMKPELRLFYDSLVSDFNSFAKNKEYVFWINKHFANYYAISSTLNFPNVKLQGLNNKEINLNDFKGKVIYVDFWGTWCVPCLVNMNESKKLNKKFSKDDVVFLYVNLKDTKERWRKHIKKFDFDGVHVFADKENSEIIYKELMIESVPRYLLISKNGKIINAFAQTPFTAEESIRQAINK